MADRCALIGNKRCPEKGGDGGCPFWWEFVNAEDGITRGCGAKNMLQIMTAQLAASEHASASANEARNHMQHTRKMLATAINQADPAPAIGEDPKPGLQIENKR